MTEMPTRARSRVGRRSAGARSRTVGDRSRIARWRVATRLAQRQVRRSWASSLLVVLLVALPIAAMSAAAVYVASGIAEPDEAVRVELGDMEGWIAGGGPVDADFWQSPTDPSWTGFTMTDGSMVGGSSVPVSEDVEVLGDPTSLLPAGTETVPISTGAERVRTDAGVVRAEALAGSVADPRFSGKYTLVEGVAPQGDGEVLVTASMLDDLDIAVGSELSIVDTDETVRVVGIVDVASASEQLNVIVFADATRYQETIWHLPELSLSWPEIEGLNAEGAVVYSRQVILDPPQWTDPWGNTTWDNALAMMWSLAASLAIAAAFAAYVVIMLAGAAFAVSARRQQRALAIAASVGADRRDLRRTIVVQGAVLGAVGGALGVGLGIALAAILLPLLSDGSATMFWGFHVPWVIIGPILVFATLVGTASALAPARSVAKSDVISSLRGARKPQTVRASRPIWGSMMILVGIAVTVLCGIAAAATTMSTTIPYDSPLRWLPFVGIVAGPVIAQLGIVLSGRWLLWVAAQTIGRVGLAARIALRDATANASRTVPAFAAIGATVFGATFAVAIGAMVTAQADRNYVYSAPVGTAQVYWYGADGWELDPTDTATIDDARASARAALEEAGASAVAEVRRQDNWRSADEVADIPSDASLAVAMAPEDALIDPEQTSSSFSWGSDLSDRMDNISVVASDELGVLLGREPSAAELETFENGGALVADAPLIEDGRITISAWTARDVYEGAAPNNVTLPFDDVELAEPVWTEAIAARAIEAPSKMLGVVISPETADSLGLSTHVDRVFGEFPEGTANAQAKLSDALDVSSGETYQLSGWVETGPGGLLWVLPLLAVAGMLVIGASAVALGLARFERRPDDATLAAVGGTRGMRRRIAFWQGLVIAGFGTFSGAVAGVLPSVGFRLWSEGDVSNGPLELADVPWWIIVAFAVGLPLIIAGVNALIPPRHPDLTRRTAIA